MKNERLDVRFPDREGRAKEATRTLDMKLTTMPAKKRLTDTEAEASAFGVVKNVFIQTERLKNLLEFVSFAERTSLILYLKLNAALTGKCGNQNFRFLFSELNRVVRQSMNYVFSKLAVAAKS